MREDKDNIVQLQARVDAQIALQVDPPGEPMPNARRFVKHEFDHAERPLLVHQGGVFYRYEGTCWPTLDDAELKALLYEHFEDKRYIAETKDGPENKPFAPNRYKVADLVDAMKAVVHVSVNTATPSWLSNISDLKYLAADELVACSNGLVHVPTRTLYAHTPTYYTHHSVPFDFDRDAAHPERWIAFLSQLWPGDQESIETLQELFGYIVAGDTRQQKMFLLVGPKRSGKGTIARILKAMIGMHNVAGPTLASLGTNFGLSPLIGKPVAIVADARLKASDNSIVTERLLSISGEDVLTVDRKYREPWTGQIPARVLILSNELPRLTDSSGALASRFIVLTMTTSFYDRENPNLTAELSTELPGIFNWALDGLERLRARGRFVQPKASQEAIRELEDLGSPVGAFVREECSIGAEFTIACSRLYDAWKAWCEEHGRGTRPIPTSSAVTFVLSTPVSALFNIASITEFGIAPTKASTWHAMTRVTIHCIPSKGRAAVPTTTVLRHACHRVSPALNATAPAARRAAVGYDRLSTNRRNHTHDAAAFAWLLADWTDRRQGQPRPPVRHAWRSRASRLNAQYGGRSQP